MHGPLRQKQNPSSNLSNCFLTTILNSSVSFETADSHSNIMEASLLESSLLDQLGQTIKFSYSFVQLELCACQRYLSRNTMPIITNWGKSYYLQAPP